MSEGLLMVLTIAWTVAGAAAVARCLGFRFAGLKSTIDKIRRWWDI